MLLRYLVSNFLKQQGQAAVRNMVEEKLAEQNAAQFDSADIPQPDVVVLFALGIESSGLKQRLESPTPVKLQGRKATLGKLGDLVVAVVDSGVGRKQAAAATRDIIEIIAPKWIVSAGFAGGLHSQLKRGHVLMADRVCDLSGKETLIPLNLTPEQIAASPGLHVGRLLTVDKIIRTVEEKRELGETRDALAVDMETLAVAEACQEMKRKMLSVRIISDTVEQPLPRDLEKMMSQKTTAGMLGAAAATLFNRPASVKDMWNLHAMASKASDQLAGFLEGILPQLDSAVKGEE